MNNLLPWLVPLLSVVVSTAGAQPPGSFTATGNMRSARSAHTATLLTSGKVLLAGGGTSNAELFDPSTGSFEPTGSMTTPRRFHTATLLADGRVLVVGGFLGTSNAITTTAELYDPVNGVFAPAGEVPSTSSQAVHTATLLGNGKVLIAGLDRRFPVLFNPASGHFETGARYADPNVSLMGTATLLRDGKVLLTGLINTYEGVGFAEIYDPATDAFSLTGGPTPDLRWCWNVNTATLLRDGRVLIVGNAENDGSPADAVLYNPATGLFTRIGHTASPHEFATATLLPDGTVLIAGGQLPGGSGDAGVDLFEPASGTFYPLGTMVTARHSHTATLLRDGRVLIAGGNTSWPNPGSTAEIFQPLISASPAHLINLSARATTSNGAGSLVAGFALQGAGAKSLLIRGVGPTLARPPFSVPGAAASVQLRLNNRAGVQLDSNAAWNASPLLTQATQLAGAFPLTGGSADAALLATLGADTYTAEVSGQSGSGVALVEVYDIGGLAASAPRLSNLSVRANIGEGDNLLVAGFVMGGTDHATVLVRAIGPTLAKPPFNVQGALAAPALKIYDARGDLVASNVTWGGTAALTYAFARAGAFRLPGDSNDAACVVTLPPGAYTVQVSGVNQTTGIALIEVYDLQ